MIDSFIPGQWYTNGVRPFQVLGIEDGRLHVRFHDESGTTHMTERTIAKVVWPIDEPPATILHTARDQSAARSASETSTFQLKETTPIVAELIRKNGRPAGEYLTHDDIVQLILNDPKGRHLVDEAIRLGNPDPPAKIAGNMLDFMSKNITERKRGHATGLERRKIDGKWGYRPR